VRLRAFRGGDTGWNRFGNLFPERPRTYPTNASSCMQAVRSALQEGLIGDGMIKITGRTKAPKGPSRKRAVNVFKVPEQKETPITNAIREVLAIAGIRHWKQWQGPFSEKGIPDIIGIKKVKVAELVAAGVDEVGIFVGIEVKRQSVKKLREAQEKWKRYIEESRGIHVTARSIDDAIDGLGIRNRFLF